VPKLLDLPKNLRIGYLARHGQDTTKIHCPDVPDRWKDPAGWHIHASQIENEPLTSSLRELPKPLAGAGGRVTFRLDKCRHYGQGAVNALRFFGCKDESPAACCHGAFAPALSR